MTEKNDFYERLHAEHEEYSGATYDVSGLVRSRAFACWLRKQNQHAGNILDVGCGKGYFLRDLSNEMASRHVDVGRVVGMDLVRSSDNVFSKDAGKYEFIETDVDNQPLPFDNHYFDIISCNHVLEHVFETEKLLREIGRVVSPTGLVIISAPNIAAWINRVLFLFGGQPLGSEVGTESGTYGFWPPIGKRRLERFKPAGHIRDFTPRALEDLCLACDLRVVGWWNQSQTPFFPLTRWAGRNMGAVCVKVAER